MTGHSPSAPPESEHRTRHMPVADHATPDDGAMPDVGRVRREPARKASVGDARRVPLSASSVDLVVTSPPYWRKRDYGVAGQIGQESSREEYVDTIIAAMREWRRVLRPSGSVFLNIGDTYAARSLQGIPSLVEEKARKDAWVVRNRIVWVKRLGMPDPVQNRLASRHEYILHLTGKDYYYDLFGYAERYSKDGRGANPGDVWELAPRRKLARHLAPFPAELVERAITLACPRFVCTSCARPVQRRVERTMELDPSRPQARRALELMRANNLRPEHIAAVQATGISDAGKARSVQSGTDKNTESVRALALEAKKVLGGYFREFTFAKRRSAGWVYCGCNADLEPGVVLDPFMGSGTTLDVATGMGRTAVGVDLDASLVAQAE